MERAVSVEVMRQSDAWTIANKIPSEELMRRAGEGIFKSAKWKPPVAVVCGSGNNAGDGYVVADLLHNEGVDVTIICVSEKFSEDGKYYYDICLEHGVQVRKFTSETDAISAEEKTEREQVQTVSAEEKTEQECAETISDLSGYATILDCILGTGFQGEPRGNAKAAIEQINASGAYVISADINSGLNGDSGMGTTYVKSDLTVSIGDYKLGHFKGLADTAMKEKVNVDIGIEIQGDYSWFD